MFLHKEFDTYNNAENSMEKRSILEVVEVPLIHHLLFYELLPVAGFGREDAGRSVN